MTPRRAGWLTGLVVFAAMAGVEGAILVARNAASVAAPEGGGFGLAFALRAGTLAAAAGLLVAAMATAGREGRRPAIVTALTAFLVVGLFVGWQSARSSRAAGEGLVEYGLELVAAFLTVGATFAIAAAAIAWWTARHAVGRDRAERVLALETTSLRGAQAGWGAAMMAELASIDEPVQRDHFARSAAAAAFRQGTGRWPLVLAGIAGLGAGAVVFAAARVSFDRTQDRGIIGEPLLGLVLLLIVAAVAAGTLIGRSFRAGLETAVLTWLAIYLCTLAVEIPQALAWFHDGGVLLLDGEGAASHGVDAVGAALQPITHPAFLFVSAAQLAIAVLTAALTATALRVTRR